MKLQAIETTYAGCRFRSRLEARWAVFFDHLGIAWEYEAQGYELRPRLTLGDEVIHYLPDFWLPEHQAWAEVKGSLDHDELVRLLDAAAALLDHCDSPNGFIVLGHIPRPGPTVTTTPVRLHMHKGDLQAFPWNPWVRDNRCGHPHQIVGRDVGGDFLDDVTGTPFDSFASWQEIADLLLTGAPAMVAKPMEMAYTAARSARFEHGQSGAR